MPCDKFMQLPLEDRLELSSSSSSQNIGGINYSIRVNPNTQQVEYQFSENGKWVVAD